MLSKYYHLEEKNSDVFKVDRNIFLSALLGVLREEYEEVKIERTYPGGTLGIFFELYIGGKRKFVKTHQQGSRYRENLEKEIEIMSIVYGDIMEIEKTEIEVEGEKYIFLIMDYLLSGMVNEPKEVQKCIEHYQQKLERKTVKVKYTFEQVLKAGSESLEILYERNFLTEKLYLRCKESLQRIVHRDIGLFREISHGDLSNVNIMSTQSGFPVIIDWEDSLVAFPEYDYLYWLTFFSQRKYYSSILFERNGIDKIWGTDIMVLITIVKSYMSYQNESYRNNKLSFEDRINEIYGMLE